MSVTALELVGRQDELGAIALLLDDVEQLPRVKVLAGEAGIGKTTVWLAACEAARARGYRVLSSRPSEAETRFSYAGLTDLLGPIAPDVLPALPPIQRRALEAALLLGESEIAADDRAVAAAFLGALRLLAGEGPVCLAVDDLQWLDAASLATLRFALARTEAEPVTSLLAVRGGVPEWVDRAVPAERLHTLDLNGLSIGAIQELLRSRVGATFARPTLIRIWETSKGNPFFALELARALQRKGGTLGLGDDLPISSDLDELLQARLDGLSSGALEIARTAAALAEPTVALVEAAIGGDRDADLAETLQKRILELEDDRLRFSHPLLGSAVAARDTPANRRALHARLATLAPTAEERARHLALAATEPDSGVAAILEDAARSAHGRGAPAAAAELAEQSYRRTPDGDAEDARRRLLFAAERYHIAGDIGRATSLLEHALPDATPPDLAVILNQLGDILADVDPRRSEELYREALEAAQGDDALEAATHVRLADSMRWGAGIEHGVAHSLLAVEAASRTDDVTLRCQVLAIHGDWHFRAGRGIAAELHEALALERGLQGWPLIVGPLEYYCHELIWSAEPDRARPLLLELCDVRRKENDAGSVSDALWHLAFLEWRAGNWDDADRYFAEFSDLRIQLLGSLTYADEFPAAIIAAHRGRIDEARDRSRRSIVRGDAAGVGIERSGHSWVLGFVELSLDDPGAAVVHLRASYEVRNTFMLEPAQRLELGDLLEALIATGELDEAGEILDTWEPRARAVDRSWSLAILARCRGLLLAAQGDLDGALASLDRALEQHERSSDPFQYARTVVALGRTQRRAKQRGSARATLEDALRRFEHLGAPLWAERTRAELSRIGGRAPSRGELTEAERRIAELVARGSTNREVAAALFVTQHSVETSLTRIYRKLGVRSRAELASHYSSNT